MAAAIHIDNEDAFGSSLASQMYWFFVRREINGFSIQTSDGTLYVEGFIQDDRRIVRLVDTTA